MPAPAPTKPKPAPAIAPKAKAAANTQAVSTGRVKRGVVSDQGERIGIYGPGGIGKTELVAALAQVNIDPLFIDLDQGSMGLDIARAVAGADDHLVTTFDEVRSVLQDHALITQFGAVVIDTFSTLEERIREHVIDTVPHEKGRPVKSIEDYGFGKGFMHIFEKALLVLQDLDAISRMGVHVVVVCHQVAEKVPSAESDDYLEYQPRLQSPGKQGKLRERMFEWCNHFFRVDHDRFVEDGKAATGDSRSIHTVRTTTAWAKHRTMANGNEFDDVIAYPKGSAALWETMFGRE